MPPDPYLSPIEDPLVIGSADDVAWVDEADLVVIGLGGAGGVAALQARELGADVIAIDRFHGGGATANSGGVIYAGGTRFQRDAGIEDSPENMFAYLSQEQSAVNEATLRRFCESSSDDIEWLSAHGLHFGGKAYLQKTAYPPDGHYLYYSGNENVPVFRNKAAPAARGHRAHGTGMTGHAYYAALRQAVEVSGVRLCLHSPVRRLVMDQSGAVIGVEIAPVPEGQQARHRALYDKIIAMRPFSGKSNERAIAATARFERQFNTRKLIRARKGVVLATGGFINNLAMLSQHQPAYGKAWKALTRIGSMGCDGSGIDLGRSAGGATRLMDRLYTGRTIAPPNAFMGGVLVDQDGRRFVNEDAYSGFVGGAIGRLPNAKAWLILDRDSYREAIRQCLFTSRTLYLWTIPALLNLLIGGTRKAATIAELAKKCGFDAQALAHAIATNNAAADGAGTDEMGKDPAKIHAIARAPYRAINMSLDNPWLMSVCFSLGGLCVNEDSGAVLKQDGSAIAGLYAAGRAAVGLCSMDYVSGMSIADTVFSGRRAARSITALAAPAD